MHTYYIIVDSKFFACWNDFSYDHIWDLRMYLIYTIRQALVTNNLNNHVVHDLTDDALHNIHDIEEITATEKIEKNQIMEAIKRSIDDECSKYDNETFTFTKDKS
jgi:hypothetical protein